MIVSGDYEMMYL